MQPLRFHVALVLVRAWPVPGQAVVSTPYFVDTSIMNFQQTSVLEGQGTSSSSSSRAPASQSAKPKRAGLGMQCRGIWTAQWSDEEARRELFGRLEPPLREVLERHECPYGRALPGDVTWPNPPESLRDLVAPMHALQLIAVVYGYLPYLLGARATVAFATCRGTRQLWVLGWLFLMVGLSELFFKKLWRQPRPGAMLQMRDFDGNYVGSCLRSCGMPSSHSALAVGWLLLKFLDAVYRVHPFALGDKTQTMPIRPDATSSEKAKKCLRLYLWVPWIDPDLLTHTQFVVYVSAWFVILAPVPFMRVVLYDHTFAQVVAGAVIGVIVATFWWRVGRYLQRKYHDREGQRVFYDLLVHNHKLAKFHVTGSGDGITGQTSLLGVRAP